MWPVHNSQEEEWMWDAVGIFEPFENIGKFTWFLSETWGKGCLANLQEIAGSLVKNNGDRKFEMIYI